jgi:hypothetical protein
MQYEKQLLHIHKKIFFDYVNKTKLSNKDKVLVKQYYLHSIKEKNILRMYQIPVLIFFKMLIGTAKIEKSTTGAIIKVKALKQLK